MKKKSLIALFVFLIVSFTNAQNVVNVTSVIGFPASVNLGNSYSFSVELTYISGVSSFFNPDYLRLRYLTDKMVELDEDPGYVGPPENNLTFNQGVPQLLTINDFPFDSSNFRQGGNIVVIWPSYAGGTAGDSLEVSLEGVIPDSANAMEKLHGIDLQTVWLNEGINWPALEKAGISKGFVLNEDGKILHALHKDIAFAAKQLESGIHYFVFSEEKGRFIVFKEFKR